MNIGKAVDRRLNKKRKVVGVKKRGDVEEAKKKELDNNLKIF